ncbi:hypothetical protein RRG08_022530 [Elysia crispata]|uniref:Uncharacterized protein n=1 Tax=Elysia crispata TaxID=231223 RepID=A0AAE0Z2T9_9GAST|nr:hypothetical protein RRG08_022530 [Elysia crispata]
MRPTLCHGFESKITSQEGPLTTRLLGEFHGSLAGSHSNRWFYSAEVDTQPLRHNGFTQLKLVRNHCVTVVLLSSN